MAEIHFFMTFDESRELAKVLINQFNVRFIPEISSEPIIKELKSIDDFRLHIKEYSNAPRYFLVSDQWSKFPLYQKELNSKGHHYFYIMQRHGGPAFDWILSREYEKDGKKWIVPGSISDYPWYMTNEGIEKTFARPDTMKEEYKKISRIIRKKTTKSICKEKGFNGPLISQYALKDFCHGVCLRTGNFHFEPITGEK